MNNLVCKLSYSLDRVRTPFGATAHLNTIVTQITVHRSHRSGHINAHTACRNHGAEIPSKCFSISISSMWCAKQTNRDHIITNPNGSMIRRLNFIWWFQAMAQPRLFEKNSKRYSIARLIQCRLEYCHYIKIHANISMSDWVIRGDLISTTSSYCSKPSNRR